MRVVVCVGRDFKPTPADAWALRAALRMLGATEVLHGGARGADEWAGRVAARLGLPVRVFPADWKAHGPSAGPRRNRAMLDEADAVVACPGGRGTADCVAEARARSMPVVEVRK
jgi:cysteine synthase